MAKSRLVHTRTRTYRDVVGVDSKSTLQSTLCRGIGPTREMRKEQKHEVAPTTPDIEKNEIDERISPIAISD